MIRHDGVLTLQSGFRTRSKTLLSQITLTQQASGAVMSTMPTLFPSMLEESRERVEGLRFEGEGDQSADSPRVQE